MSTPDRVQPRSSERAGCDDCDWTAEGIGSFEAADRHFATTAHRVNHQKPLDYLDDPHPTRGLDTWDF